MEQEMKSEQINELAKALSIAQGAMNGAKKESANPFFKSKYADLGSVWDAIRKPLSDNGLSVVQTVDGDKLLTILMHASGQWIDSTYPITAKDNSPQAIGSALTYARRYALAAMVGVYQTDDDAEAATERQPAGEVPVLHGAHNMHGAYIIKMGKKFKGLRLDACDMYELADFSKWLSEQPDLKGVGLETRDNIEAYLSTKALKK
jgi:hypothetical protein